MPKLFTLIFILICFRSFGQIQDHALQATKNIGREVSGIVQDSAGNPIRLATIYPAGSRVPLEPK